MSQCFLQVYRNAAASILYGALVLRDGPRDGGGRVAAATLPATCASLVLGFWVSTPQRRSSRRTTAAANTVAKSLEARRARAGVADDAGRHIVVSEGRPPSTAASLVAAAVETALPCVPIYQCSTARNDETVCKSQTPRSCLIRCLFRLWAVGAVVIATAFSRPWCPKRGKQHDAHWHGVPYPLERMHLHSRFGRLGLTHSPWGAKVMAALSTPRSPEAAKLQRQVDAVNV